MRLTRLFLITGLIVELLGAFSGTEVSAGQLNPSLPKGATTQIEPAPTSAQKTTRVTHLMSQLRGRIRKFQWDESFFSEQGWLEHGTSVNGHPLIYWTCGNRESNNVSLVLSTVHGDEVTPVYFGFRLVEWVKARPELCKDRFIVIAPMVNPDGFLRYTNGTRTNFNKVDLNRNFDTPEWEASALTLWKSKFNSQRRYFPGDRAASEPETQFQKWLIEEFRPVKILSVHAPLNILDYDGPQTEDALKFSKKYKESCEALKSAVAAATPSLQFFAYGHFPGSLGNYAGAHKGIPTLTAELPTADPKMAAHYFGLLEKGTRLFMEYEIKDRPVSVSKSGAAGPSTPD